MGGGASQNQQIPQPASQPNPPTEIEPNSQIKKGVKKGIKDGVKNKQQKDRQKVGSGKTEDQQGNPSIKNKVLSNFAPPCANRKKSTYVCLGKSCKQYAFYCLNCQFQCSEAHLHGKKCQTVSVKEFQKRINNKASMDPILTQAIQSYKQSLTQMKENFHEFYLHENNQMENVQQMKKIPPQNAQLLKKIEKGHKQGLNGKQMKQLWEDSADWKQQQQRLIKLIKKRKQFLINLYECFTNINLIQQEQIKSKEGTPAPPEDTLMKQQQAYHYYKRYQFDPNSLILSKQGIWSSSKRK